MSNEKKYPFEIASVVQKQTLSLESHLTVNGGDKPLSIFDDTFSRYVLAVLAEQKDKRYAAATCNIPEDMLAGIQRRTELATEKYYSNLWAPKYATNSGIDTSGPAFTVKFAMGNLKGKSPAEVILENADGKKLLNDQYAWLKSKADEMEASGDTSKKNLIAGNRKMMAAIVEASKLDIEALKKSEAEVASTPTMEILRIDTRPLVRKQREDGKCFCYECSVVLNPSNKYPVNVRVENYYAPVVKNETTKLYNVQLSKKDTEKGYCKNEINLSVDQWLAVVGRMVDEKNDFRAYYYNAARKTAIQIDKQAREASRAAS